MNYHRAVGLDVTLEYDVHIVYPLFLKRGQYSLSCVESKAFSYRRTRCRTEHLIFGTSPSVGLRRGLSVDTCFCSQLVLVTGFRRVSSLGFLLVLSRVLNRHLITKIHVVLGVFVISLLKYCHQLLVVLPYCGYSSF